MVLAARFSHIENAERTLQRLATLAAPTGGIANQINRKLEFVTKKYLLNTRHMFNI